jgi:DNA-binding transcriptional MocR family regulator
MSNAIHAGTRTGEVIEAIRRRIASRDLGAGDRLPSIRGLAATLKVSPSTVVEAYDRLVAEGLVRARRGSGFYVAAVLPALPVLAPSDRTIDRAVDPFWVSRQSLDSVASTLKPGCGWLPADWMPVELLRRAFRALGRADESVLADYGGTRGSLALRRMLTARFAEESLETSPEQVILTGSGTQSIDLVCRYLLQPGDTVIVDDPCYFNFRALLKAHQVTIVGVAMTPSGPDLGAFEAALRAHRPKLYITNSAIHNPTGATLSLQCAHRLLLLAAQHDLTIVEDDIFADFEPEPSPRLAVLDGLDRVIRIGSFSKTLSASLRCGYIAARADWIEDLVDLQIATQFGGAGPVVTDVIGQVLAGGAYRKHMAALRRRLFAARREVADRLAPIGVTPWLMPRGGFYLWCRCDSEIDTADVARRALADGVVLAPGNVFSVGHSAGAYLRFNVAQSGDPRIWSVLEKAFQPRP